MDQYLIDEAINAIKNDRKASDFYNEIREWYPELQPIEIVMVWKKAVMLVSEGY